MQLPEYLLHYLWKTRSYRTPLYTTNGQALIVVFPGYENVHEGPDFLEAHIQLDQVHWHGSVEVHHKTSDWLKHGHNNNAWYQQTILHVVLEHDMPEADAYGLPVLEVGKYLSKSLVATATRLLETEKTNIPCHTFLPDVPHVVLRAQLQRAWAERLASKAAFVKNIYLEHKNWNDAFYRYLFYCMGFKLNSEALYSLAGSIPFAWIEKNSYHPECLLGVFSYQAGFVPMEVEAAWKAEHEFFMYKCHAHRVPPPLWRFLRTRPANFPTVRLAQALRILVAYLDNGQHFWHQEGNLHSLENLLVTRGAPFHYAAKVGNSFSLQPIPPLGKAALEILKINFLCVLKYAYLDHLGLETEKERIFDYMQSLPAENNHITRMFIQFGILPYDAADTQAMLHLYKQYCLAKKCLDCQIGVHICRQGEIE